MSINTYIEHEQVGQVRFMPTDNTAQVAWYDHNGNSNVAESWLCGHMAALRGGTWRVTARHHAGNGHFSADMQKNAEP